ncbi:MAG: hypothetical protein R3Y65_04220 [Bacillota bacterium]
MKYYYIQIRKKDLDRNENFGVITNTIAVSGEEELIKHIDETVKEFDIVDNYINDTIEITEQEAIEKYEACLKEERIKRYLVRNKYDELSVRDFCKKQKDCQGGIGYFEVVKEEEQLIFLQRKFRKHYDLSEITVSQYEELIAELMNATTDEEFEEIASGLVRKEDKISV